MSKVSLLNSLPEVLINETVIPYSFSFSYSFFCRKMPASFNQETLSNHEIDRILHSLPFFKGTFSSDTIPTIPIQINSPQAFIINTARQNRPGEHWVGFIINEQRKCFFFDSFGNQILNLDILYSLKRMGIDSYIYNTKEIQSIFSNSCGYFCIAFVLAWKQKIPNNIFLSLFSEYNQESNDILCYEFIKQAINS